MAHRSFCRAAVALCAAVLLAPAGPARAADGAAWTSEGEGKEVVLSRAADGARSGRGPKVVVRCHGRKVRAGIDGVQLAAGDVTFRLDQEPPVVTTLEAMTRQSDGLLLKLTDLRSYESGRYFPEKTDLVARLLAHRRLLMRLTPVGQPSQQVSFDVTGLDPLLARLEHACNVERPAPRTAVPAAAPPVPPSAAPAPPQETRFGKWVVRKITSELDVIPVVMLVQESATAIVWDDLRKSTAKPVFVMRCRQKVADAYLDFGYLTVRGYNRVVRASVEPGKQATWGLDASTDATSFFFLNTPALVKRLLASRELRLQLGSGKPDDDKGLPAGEMVFDLTGFDQAVKPFLEACPFDLSKTKVKDGLGKLP